MPLEYEEWRVPSYLIGYLIVGTVISTIGFLAVGYYLLKAKLSSGALNLGLFRFGLVFGCVSYRLFGEYLDKFF